jgi:PPOX class probable F420-dependent enzyme
MTSRRGCEDAISGDWRDLAMDVSATVRAAIEAGPIGHVVTLGQDGAPQCSLAWIGFDGEEVVIGTMFDQAKLRNLRRDPRIAISFETGRSDPYGLNEYGVLHGRARITEGGAPALLGRLAQTYIGPGTVYPPFPDPPDGWVIRVTVERVSGSEPLRHDPGSPG